MFVPFMTSSSRSRHARLHARKTPSKSNTIDDITVINSKEHDAEGYTDTRNVDSSLETPELENKIRHPKQIARDSGQRTQGLENPDSSPIPGLGSSEDTFNMPELKILLSSVSEDSSLNASPPTMLSVEELQRLTDGVYGALISSQLDWVVISEVLARIWSSTRTVPSQLHVRVTNPSSYPFATTSSSNITKGNIDSMDVALKTFRRFQGPISQTTIKRFFFEAVVWSLVKHLNIIPFLGIHNSPSGDIYMVSKFEKHGTLLNYLDSHPEADKLHMLSGIASAVAYLHNLQIPVIHGDIRGMNILVNDSGEPLLTDFGYSLLLDPVTSQPIPPAHLLAGNVRWTANEKIQPCQFPVTVKSDVYSFACLCVEVFSHTIPFDHLRKDGAVVIEVLVRQRHPVRPVGPHAYQLTDSLWELLIRCWAQDPKTRPSMNEIYSFLISHPVVSIQP